MRTLTLLFLLFVIMSSCNHYIDKAASIRTTSVNQGRFTFYHDSNVLVYRSNIKLKMDQEVLTPKPFYIKLPKGIQWYEMDYSQYFIFFYNQKQAIAINIDLEDSKNDIDTSFTPRQTEISRLISTMTSSSSKKYDINKVGLEKKRKQLIIQKGAAKILLYNIKTANYNMFVDFCNRFTFL